MTISEHTCYACTTKMNNPKARHTCYGTHSIPCARYHQTMHAIGTSHNCKACITADEVHTERHKQVRMPLCSPSIRFPANTSSQIATLVAEYKKLEEEDNTSSVKNKKARRQTLGDRDPNTQTPTRNLFFPPPQTNLDFDHENDDDNGTEEEEEEEEEEEDSLDSPSLTNSASNNSTSSTTPSGKLTKAETRYAKRAAKSTRSQQKSLRNQHRHLVTIKSTDVEHVHVVLHGELPSATNGSATDVGSRHPLATDKCIEDVMNRNRAYVANITQHKAWLLKSVDGRKKQEREKRVRRQRMEEGLSVSEEKGWVDDGEEGERLDEVVDAVLVKFGIALSVSGGSSASVNGAGHRSGNETATPKRSAGGSVSARRDVVVAQLRALVVDDLIKFENEQRQTCIRAGGFWRYVGKSVFERMMEVTRGLDWKTGVIRKESCAEEDGADEVDDRLEGDVGEQVQNEGGERAGVEDVQEQA